MTEAAEYDGRRWRGTFPVTVSAAQAAAGTELVSGPVRLMGWSLAATATPALAATGQAAAPAAGATIVSVNAPRGDYTANIRIAIGGTTGAAEQNNFALFVGAQQITVLEIGTASGQDVQQMPIDISVPVGGAVVSVQAVGNATAASTYRAELSLIAQEAASATLLDGGQVVGSTSPVGGASDTQWFGEHGVYIGTQLAIQSAVGAVSGCVYVKECERYA